LAPAACAPAVRVVDLRAAGLDAAVVDFAEEAVLFAAVEVLAVPAFAAAGLLVERLAVAVAVADVPEPREAVARLAAGLADVVRLAVVFFAAGFDADVVLFAVVLFVAAGLAADVVLDAAVAGFTVAVGVAAGDVAGVVGDFGLFGVSAMSGFLRLLSSKFTRNVAANTCSYNRPLCALHRPPDGTGRRPRLAGGPAGPACTSPTLRASRGPAPGRTCVTSSRSPASPAAAARHAGTT
jgi:hypothetical protein